MFLWPSLGTMLRLCQVHLQVFSLSLREAVLQGKSNPGHGIKTRQKDLMRYMFIIFDSEMLRIDLIFSVVTKSVPQEMLISKIFDQIRFYAQEMIKIPVILVHVNAMCV